MPAWTALPTAALWFPAVRDSLAAYRNSFALVRYARPSAALTARGWPPLPATSGRFSQPFEPTADQDYPVPNDLGPYRGSGSSKET